MLYRSTVLVAGLAACGNSVQVSPPFSGVDGGNKTDAHESPDAARAVDAREFSDAPTMITGRVCILSDPRVLDECEDSGYSGMTVALDGAIASVGSDGSFTIASPTSSSPTWRASATNVVTTLTGFTEVALVPVMSQQTYTQLGSANGVTLGAGGAVIVHVLHNGAPEDQALVTIGSDQTYYAGSSGTDWSSFVGTGSTGAAWIPNTATGEVAITAGSTTAYAPTEDGALTFVTIAQ